MKKVEIIKKIVELNKDYQDFIGRLWASNMLKLGKLLEKEENKSIIKEDITSLKNQNINNEKLIKDWEKVLNNYKIKNGQLLSEKRRN
jgi:tRNA nucleotidyltransferase/poly(A) polymerase